MKSIKKGRASSIAGGVIGLLAAAVMFALAGGVSSMFSVFGMSGLSAIPVAMGVIVLLASALEIYNGLRKNRLSEYDIVDAGEEPDPLNGMPGGDAEEGAQPTPAAPAQKDAVYCPYCGAETRDDYAFCMSCGKKLPHR